MMQTPAFLLLLLAAAPVVAVELVADPQPVTMVRIKDAEVAARVSLAFDRAMLLELSAAERARLRAFPLIGKRTVENSLIPGGKAVFRGNFYRIAPAGLKGVNAPVGWVDKAIDPARPAIVSIFAFDAPTVTVRRAGAAAGAREIVVPRNGESDAQSDVTFGEQVVRVSLDMGTPRTIMNWRAARALEEAGLVKRGKTVGLWAPFPNVALPYEALRPAPGATILGLPLVAPAARITEARAKQLDALAKAGTSTEEDEADAGEEITVTAKREGRQRRGWMIIGADVLDRCDRITLDRPGKRWVLRCNF